MYYLHQYKLRFYQGFGHGANHWTARYREAEPCGQAQYGPAVCMNATVALS